MWNNGLISCKIINGLSSLLIRPVLLVKQFIDLPIRGTAINPF
jgi:hypothetical protein